MHEAPTENSSVLSSPLKLNFEREINKELALPQLPRLDEHYRAMEASPPKPPHAMPWLRNSGQGLKSLNLIEISSSILKLKIHIFEFKK